MKVGVLQFFSWSRRIALADVYERAFSRIEIMDRTGYDCVWLAEHHFNTYSVCPSINVMASHVPQATGKEPWTMHDHQLPVGVDGYLHADCTLTLRSLTGRCTRAENRPRATATHHTTW
jgi:hypothetical protein